MNAFDVLAPNYDADFSHTPIASYLRGITYQRLAPLLKHGNHILELGCGTGEDALIMANHGAIVTATDASPRMLDVTRQKTHGKSVTAASLDLNNLPDEQFTTKFDGVFSNFGALNCVEKRPQLAQWLSSRLKPNGWLALVVMPPYCLWEMLWHGVHGDFKTARRRQITSHFQPSENATTLKISCPSPRTLASEFAPYFSVEQILPLGMFLPHSAAYKVVEKRPSLLHLLQSLDQYTQSMSLLSMFADHYWIVLRRHP